MWLVYQSHRRRGHGSNFLAAVINSSQSNSKLYIQNDNSVPNHPVELVHCYNIVRDKWSCWSCKQAHTQFNASIYVSLHQFISVQHWHDISMTQWKTALTPLLTHSSYYSLALNHRLYSQYDLLNMWHQDLYTVSGKTSNGQISWSIEATRLDAIIIVSFWNYTNTSEALLQRFL